jgi:hypothetical protein
MWFVTIANALLPTNRKQRPKIYQFDDNGYALVTERVDWRSRAEGPNNEIDD